MKKIKVKKEQETAVDEANEATENTESQDVDVAEEQIAESEAVDSEEEGAEASEEEAELESVTEEEAVEAEEAPVVLPPAEELHAQLLEAQAQLEQTEGLVDELRAKSLRAMADFENFKKRAQKERSEMLKYQGDRIVADLVEVLDMLQLALGYKDSDQEQLRNGLEMVCKQFVDKLDRWGIRAVSALGETFDPNTHAAISRVPVADQDPNIVINELKAAYFYKDKLIRPGEAVVSEKVPEPVVEETEEDAGDAAEAEAQDEQSQEGGQEE